MATGMAQAKINNALDTEYTGTVWVQLHTGDPGAAGTTSIATTSTRQSCTFASAASGSKATNSALSWTAAATETITNFSLWTLASGGTFLGSGTVSGGSIVSGATVNIASGSLTMTGSGAA